MSGFRVSLKEVITMANDIACYTVSQVTKLTGATAAQLKNWDKEGLLVAKRTGDGIANNRKLYSQDDVATIREILLYRSLGFGLDEIGQMLQAAPDERARLAAERTSRLKTEYSSIQKQIGLTSALEVLTPEVLLNELDCDDASTARDEYDKDENLKMMVRWMRSHTQQDADRLVRELAEIIEDISSLDADAPWEEVEARLLRFCDVWSGPFGWPTVGQMLDFATVFQEMADEPDDDFGLSDLFDADLCSKLSEIFYLAWADNGLRVLDDAFVALYLDETGLPYLKPVARLGETLCALFCELGGRPHLYKGEKPPAHSQELCEIADHVLGLLEEIILDEELGRHLDIETLFAIDHRSLDIAGSLAKATADDWLESWYMRAGIMELHELRDQWIDTLEEYWSITHPEEIAELARKAEAEAKEQRDRMASKVSEQFLKWQFDSGIAAETILDKAYDEAFWSWLKSHYARVLADPPEPHWAAEEESVAYEKKMRALVQEMVARQEAAEDVDSEADE